MKRLNWWIITFFLLFLPFQGALQRALNLPRKFLWMDEIFVAFYVVLFLLAILCQRGVKKASTQILFSLILLGIIGIISGLYNTNAFIVTANGIFDYMKYFLIIPALCLFSVGNKKMQSLHSVLHRLALFLCFIAILQEIFFFLGFPVERIGVPFTDVRFGLMRTPSFMGHPNIFGLYSLLFFVLDFSLHRRIRWQNLVFALGALLSVSRMVWTAFFSVLFLFLIHRKGKKAAGLFILVLIIFFLSLPSFYLHTAEEIGSPGYFREYVLIKSLKIWQNQPILGLGPGMYGGVVSFMFGSPIYGRYGFDERWLDVMENIFSIDQFWPQILVEMGLLGTLSFTFILFTLWRVARKEYLIAQVSFRKNILFGFSLIPLVLSVYLLGSGLNLGAFLLTYSVLFGLTLGIRNENSSNK